MNFEQGQKSDSNLNEIIFLLQENRNAILKNILLTLGLIYPSELILPLIKDFKSEDLRIRINAVEFLDNILKPTHKSIMIPVTECMVADALSDSLLKRCDINISTEFSIFELLRDEEHDPVKSKLMNLIKDLGGVQFIFHLINTRKEVPQPI